MSSRNSSRLLRPFSALVAAGLLLVPLSACATSGASSGAAPSLSSTAEVSTEALDAGASEQSPGGGSEAGPAAERSVIRTGDLTIEVADPSAAADEISGIAADLKGAVASLNLRQQGEGSAADITLRVPEDKLDEALEALSGVGAVTAESRSDVDVTTEHVDLQARVEALEKSVERLQELMRGAASTSELLEAESALSQRQQELDGLRAQLKSLEGQVAEATIHVTLTTKSALPGGGPANFWEGLLAGFSSLGTAGSGALVVLGVLLPWLTVAGIIALLVVLVVRSVRGRRAARRRARAESVGSAPAAPVPGADPQAQAPAPGADPFGPPHSGGY